MKKYLLNIMTIIMVAVMSAGFVSCSDDEDEVSIPLESLYGTWNISEIKVLESTPYYPWEFAKMEMVLEPTLLTEIPLQLM